MFEPKSFTEIDKRAEIACPADLDDAVEGYYRAVIIGDLLTGILSARRAGVTDPAVAYRQSREQFTPTNEISNRILNLFETVTI